jgi:DNA-binding transcriptional regulator YhcF (GntR family)
MKNKTIFMHQVYIHYITEKEMTEEEALEEMINDLFVAGFTKERATELVEKFANERQ